MYLVSPKQYKHHPLFPLDVPISGPVEMPYTFPLQSRILDISFLSLHPSAARCSMRIHNHCRTHLYTPYTHNSPSAHSASCSQRNRFAQAVSSGRSEMYHRSLKAQKRACGSCGRRRTGWIRWRIRQMERAPCRCVLQREAESEHAGVGRLCRTRD